MKRSFDGYAKGPWRCKTCERPWLVCICPDELKPKSRGGLKKRPNKKPEQRSYQSLWEEEWIIK